MTLRSIVGRISSFALNGVIGIVFFNVTERGLCYCERKQPSLPQRRKSWSDFSL